MQIATIAGRLGRDAELSQTKKGQDVLNFAVAVNERRGDGPPPMDAPDDGGTFSDDEIPF